METGENGEAEVVRSLVVACSYHHMNTEKVARAIAGVLGAPVITPKQATPSEVAGYDLVGFGSGIYDATFHPSLLDLAARLPPGDGRKAFPFSTYGAPAVAAGGNFVSKNHRRMRETLQARGYDVVGEFACAGWNTNVFLKYIGGAEQGPARCRGPRACGSVRPEPGGERPLTCGGAVVTNATIPVADRWSAPHIFSNARSSSKGMQPRSFHRVHAGQVAWSRVHRRPTCSMGQSSRFAQPQQHVPVARPEMKSGFRN